MGNIFTKGDYPKTVDNFIIAMQKDRPHWQPLPRDSHVPDELAAIASLFSQEESSVKNTQPISKSALMQATTFLAVALHFGYNTRQCFSVP